MAPAPERAVPELDDQNFDAGALVRTAFWGMGAAGALFLAVLAGLSETGSHRVVMAVSALAGHLKVHAHTSPEASPAKVAAAKSAPTELLLRQDTRRLQEQVRLLATDRDRLAQRVSALERNLDDVTGSVRRQEALTKEALTKVASVPPPKPPAPAPPTERPPPLPTIAASPAPPTHQAEAQPTPDDLPLTEPSPDVTASVPSETPMPPPRHDVEAEPIAKLPADKPETVPQARTSAPTETRATHAAYGVDLGGAISVDRLRLLWQKLQTSEARLLQGLQPITRTRGLKRAGRPDVRLIAGPLPSADKAAKLCAAILDAGRYCEPAVFHGQRLTSR